MSGNVVPGIDALNTDAEQVKSVSILIRKNQTDKGIS
jgi:hypothetical protein